MLGQSSSPGLPSLSPLPPRLAPPRMSLRLHSLTHRYGSHQSLRGISLHVRDGDCYGFLGHNGAGKTTALRIALGLMRPISGSVIVDGVDALRDPREARARMGGLIEVPGFYLDASGRHNLVELGRLQGMGRAAARADADRLLDLVGLEAAAGRRVGGYSQGMRQRLGLAQALLGGPGYVLLDEPTNGLDPQGIADLRAVLMRLTRNENVTVLLSSHQLQEVTGLCNRIGVLREGRLLLEAETDALLSGTASRYAIATDDDSRAVEICRGLKLECTERDHLQVDLSDVPPATLARALVDGGLGLTRFNPEPATLEEIYLEVTQEVTQEVTHKGAGDSEGPGNSDNTGEAEAPSEPTGRLAPTRPSSRMMGFELRRLSRRWSVLGALAIPPIIAWWRVGAYRDLKDGHLAEVESGKLIETMNGTAFDAMGLALRDAVSPLAVLAVLLGSQVLAAELGRGTLRNVVLRPLRRVQVLLGKFAALVVLLLSSYAATVVVAMWRAGSLFEFGDVEEHLRGEEPELVVEAIDLWPLVSDLIASMVLPLCAFVSVGILASAMAKRGVRALIVALGAFGALYLSRGIAAKSGWEWLLPSAYLPLPPGDRASYVVYFLEACFGNDAAVFAASGSVYWVPMAWCAGCLSLSALILNRRRIP